MSSELGSSLLMAENHLSKVNAHGELKEGILISPPYWFKEMHCHALFHSSSPLDGMSDKSNL